MAKSIGPILAVGAITLGNETILNNKPVDWRIPVATGIAASVFALVEKPFPKASVALAYVSLVTVLFTRINPTTPAPAESLAKFINGK